MRIILHVVGSWYPQGVGVYVLEGLSDHDAQMVARCHGCDVSNYTAPLGSRATGEDLVRLGNALSDSHEIVNPTPGYDSKWVDCLSQEPGPYKATAGDQIAVVRAFDW